MYIYSFTCPQGGKTALQLAATKSCVKVVETLLGANADVNLQEKVLGLIRVDVHVHVCTCTCYLYTHVYCTLVHFIVYRVFHNQGKRKSYCL